MAVAAAAGGSRAPAVREQPKGVADEVVQEDERLQGVVGGGILKEGRRCSSTRRELETKAEE